MSFLDYFRSIKRIYGICPCCDQPFRLSDVTLFTRSRPPQTAFDRLADEWAAFDSAMQRFEARQARIEEASRKAGRQKARRRLTRIAPFFIANKIDPRDVRVLFDPVDYIAFCGLGNGGCKSVDFIDRGPESQRRVAIHESLAAAIRNGRLEWQTYRVTSDGRVVKGR
jgi:predicted Holliday junction resolvase-like endonuclease